MEIFVLLDVSCCSEFFIFVSVVLLVLLSLLICVYLTVSSTCVCVRVCAHGCARACMRAHEHVCVCVCVCVRVCENEGRRGDRERQRERERVSLISNLLLNSQNEEVPKQQSREPTLSYGIFYSLVHNDFFGSTDCALSSAITLARLESMYDLCGLEIMM